MGEYDEVWCLVRVVLIRGLNGNGNKHFSFRRDENPGTEDPQDESLDCH